jgi:hypothetical protein
MRVSPVVSSVVYEYFFTFGNRTERDKDHMGGFGNLNNAGIVPFRIERIISYSAIALIFSIYV